MADVRDIHSLPLAPQAIQALTNHGFHLIQDFQGISPIDLTQECKFTIEDSVAILNVIKSCQVQELSLNEQGKQLSSGNEVSQSFSLLSSQVLKKENIFTAKDLIYKMASQKPIITFCKEIDVMLGGGIPVGQITEICGVPGIGKTQLAIQLAMNVQIPEVFQGCQGTAIYIDTEGSFLPERAAEIAKELSQHLPRLIKHNMHQFNQPSSNRPANLSEDLLRQQKMMSERMTTENFLNNILVYRCYHQNDLIAVLNQLKVQLLSPSSSIESSSSASSSSPTAAVIQNAKILLIDSIAFPFRTNVLDIVSRNRVLNQLLQVLNEIAFEKQLAVVLVNHMTTKIVKASNVAVDSQLPKEKSLFFKDGNSGNSFQKLVPALGEQFTHGIANRLLLHYDKPPSSEASTNMERKATLLKCSFMPSKTVSFTVSQRGIRDLLPALQSQQSQHPAVESTTINPNDKRQRIA